MYEVEVLEDYHGREIYKNDMTIYFDVVFRRIDASKREVADHRAFVPDGEMEDFLEELATNENYVSMDLIGTGSEVYERYGGYANG
ncbi:hypothetical protein [Candidatus Enterococcus clewellii]|uniref:Uncharacterized protein n=1 Tax=Candidatus Enterococcus clewellii TaxID=1834193 RepID=A0A242K3W7_9ENTE|nr:hypothetical protein [Enterococcus sp. 9E7_DIV0242]OTP13688.1 hypothetical protein A5888_003166 [Enterococcus sp. 9E7_DIV0242]